jgi:hypothetical protein
METAAHTDNAQSSGRRRRRTGQEKAAHTAQAQGRRRRRTGQEKAAHTAQAQGRRRRRDAGACAERDAGVGVGLGRAARWSPEQNVVLTF